MITLLSLIKSINNHFWLLINKNRFRNFGVQSFINKPLSLKGSVNISIGDRVFINSFTSLSANSKHNQVVPQLIFEDGCTIGNFNHIYCTQEIHFGKNVLTADKVYVSDNLHSYTDINVPIKNQPIKQLNSVYIGEGTWIGENVCIIGVKIGKNCVVGANSVVTKDIPDYSVAVGSPAKIIKRYNFELQEWIKTNPDGSFINLY